MAPSWHAGVLNQSVVPLLKWLQKGSSVKLTHDVTVLSFHIIFR